MDNSYLTDTLKRLISFETVNPPGRERELARWIAGRLQGLGFRSRLIECEPGRESVVACYGASGGTTVVLNGHLDVVPAGEGWTMPPFFRPGG